MRNTITVAASDLVMVRRRIREARGFIVMSTPVGLAEYRVTYVRRAS